jgi:inosine/xanthosine triphosphatase
MQTVIIASENPVKIEVAKRVFSQLLPSEQFEFEAILAPSGVPDQPFEEQTFLGAQNRLAYIIKARQDADYWISQEGGLFKEGTTLYNEACIMVRDKNGMEGKSLTARLYIPKEIVALVQGGKELGHAGDAFFGTVNIKHGNGLIAALTNNSITRADYYTQAATIALSQVIHQEWY